MSTSVIAYDKDLPEIPGRCPWLKPDCFLLKDPKEQTGWRVDKSGRRPSKLLLVAKLRKAVDVWRAEGYPGASEVTLRLFGYWFDEDHEVAGFPVPFRYHFCQREAMEVLAYVVEILKNRDSKELIDAYAEIVAYDLLSKTIEYQTTTDGKRQIRRFMPELEREGVQDLPPEKLRRYAFKMATGSGKTWVMAMLIVWSHFHKKLVKGSDLSTNFLVVAPNVIVYQRLEKDFASNRIFNNLPLIPPEWKGTWSQKVILRGDGAPADPSGNLFLTNIHQLYESGGDDWTPANAVEALLGQAPKDLSAHEPSMLDRIKGLKDLLVLNDEAHHVHDEDLAWSQSLLSIHQSLPKGLALWLDFSATPKDQNGMYYPWTLCDYPLAQAVEDRIVKAPLIVTKEADAKQPNDPDDITKENITEKFGYWIHGAVVRWKEHFKTYKPLGPKPVLFIMTEKNAYADVLGRYLWETKEFGLKESEVLVIHTDEKGEITKKDLEQARQAARDIDLAGNKIKAIVSVMMLREGWDVRGVTVVLGLRPFSAKAEILPEQVIGRGLRLMTGIGPDRTQTLEVLGTRKLLEVLKDQLEAEGVGVATTRKGAAPPIIVTPLEDRLKFDITIPLTKPRLVHNTTKLSDLDPKKLNPIYNEDVLEETFRITLKMEFGLTETEVHQADIMAGALPMSQELLSSITNKVIHCAKLTTAFPQLYPVVRAYVATRCFGQPVDLDQDNIRSHLHRLEIQEGIAKYLARKIAELTVEKKTLEFEKKNLKLSATKPFSWRRDLQSGPCECKKTIFNYVATYNNFERRFAKFLASAADVLRFASLGTTEQGDSATRFRVDYLKPTGAIGFYHPDWVVVQKAPRPSDGRGTKGEGNHDEVNWIIETKGRVWEGTEAKDEAIQDWCKRISKLTSQDWRFIRVDQAPFDRFKPKTLREIADFGRAQESMGFLDVAAPMMDSRPPASDALARPPARPPIAHEAAHTISRLTTKPTTKTAPSGEPSFRQLQARVLDISNPERQQFCPLTQAFHPNALHLIQLRISIRDSEWLNSNVPFPVEELPPSETGHRLTVVFSEPNLIEAPLVAHIHLPPTGESTACEFKLPVPATATTVAARVVVLYKNRALVSMLLEGSVLGPSSTTYPNSEILFHPEVAISPLFLDLHLQGHCAGALLFNHTNLGASQALSIVDDHAELIDLDNVATYVSKIDLRLQECRWDVPEYAELTSAGTVSLLRDLARHGSFLHEAVTGQFLNQTLTPAPRIQAITAKPEARFPVEYIYELPSPEPDAPLCLSSTTALKDGCLCPGCTKTKRENRKQICPLGFWGLNRVIEWHLYRPGNKKDLNGSEIALQQTKVALGNKLNPLKAVLFAASNRADAALPGATANVRAVLGPSNIAKVPINDWQKWTAEVQENSPSLLLLIPHTDKDFAGICTLEIGNHALAIDQLGPSYVTGPASDSPPVVFLLGCETGAPEISFEGAVARFRSLGASIIVSTTSGILGRHAALVASTLFNKLKALSGTQNATFGDIILATRRQLLTNKCPVVLILASYGDADWEI